jgi:hypothetical protein
MKNTITFLRKAWYQSKIVLHHTSNAVWKWCKYEFTGHKGKRKREITGKVLMTTVVILWSIIKTIGIALLVIIMIFKLLLSIGSSDD